MTKLDNRMFAVVAVSIDFAGRVEFKIKKLFWEEHYAERYMKQNTEADPDEKYLEIHEVEAPE
jgi:hypothetical protein